MQQNRQMHLNAFLLDVGHHEAAWRRADSNLDADIDIDYWIRMAQKAEAAKFDSLFLQDLLCLFGTGDWRPPGQLEPLTLLTAIACSTERIGLMATVSTTYNEPYNLARRLAAVDHVSKGRLGWNIVTSENDAEAINFGYTSQTQPAERYERAHDFVTAVTKLWDSWADDAVIADRATGHYADVSKLRRFDHQGKYFSVAGPLNIRRPPQGRPVLVQAGSSESGRSFAAQWADAVFTAHVTFDNAAEFYGDIKRRATEAGRDPDTIAVLPGIVPIIGSTEAEAAERGREFENLIVMEHGLDELAEFLEADPSEFALDERIPSHVLERPRVRKLARTPLIVEMATKEKLTAREIIVRISGGRGHNVVVGTPERIVDGMVRWFENGAADGFNVMPAAIPSGLDLFIDHVLPILRSRGLFREEYEGSTLRDHLGLERPSNQFD